MTYTYPTGRTTRTVYEELYQKHNYGGGEHGQDMEWALAGCESMLDVGGGRTPTASRYKAAGKLKRVAVVDISQKALSQQPHGIETLQCDVTAGLPYGDDEFDVITCFDVLEHLQEDAVSFVLAEFARVARHKLILSITHRPANRDAVVPDEPLHMTVQPELWWLDKLAWYGRVSKHRCRRTTKAGRCQRYGTTILVELI